MLGTLGDDDIRGKAGNDNICGMGGDDFIDVNSGDDWIDDAVSLSLALRLARRQDLHKP